MMVLMGSEVAASLSPVAAVDGRVPSFPGSGGAEGAGDDANPDSIDAAARDRDHERLPALDEAGGCHGR